MGWSLGHGQPAITECAAASALASDPTGVGRITIGADKGYDRASLVEEMRDMKVTLQARSGRPDRLSTVVRRAIPATPTASDCASGSRNRSGGER